jgi:CRISPR system Cascade subunit CasB
MSQDEEQKRMTPRAFVEWIIREITEQPVESEAKLNTAMRARLRRADNPDTEQDAYRYLIKLVPDFDKKPNRLKVSATVAAALARAELERDGDFRVGFGQSLATAYDDEALDKENNPAETRLRRILACRTIEEVCDVLRPLLPFVAKRTKNKPQQLSFTRLLRDLNYPYSAATDVFLLDDDIKRRWAREFYSRPAPEGETPSPQKEAS